MWWKPWKAKWLIGSAWRAAAEWSLTRVQRPLTSGWIKITHRPAARPPGPIPGVARLGEAFMSLCRWSETDELTFCFPFCTYSSSYTQTAQTMPRFLCYSVLVPSLEIWIDKYSTVYSALTLVVSRQVPCLGTNWVPIVAVAAISNNVSYE